MTLVAIARDEGPYLLEWIAWHRLLGVERIVIYDNASTDGSTDRLAALARAGEIGHVPWPDVPGRSAQLPAYTDALRQCRTEWIGFLDLDEFILLHEHPDIRAFLAMFRPVVSAVAINQCVFGSNRLRAPDARLVIERFTGSSPPGLVYNTWVKTIARRASVIAPGIHAPHTGGGLTVDPTGIPVRLHERERQMAVTHGVAQINHYIVKSAAEFEIKRRRGQADFPRGAVDPIKRYSDAFFKAHDVNTVRSTAAAQRAPAVSAEMERLSAVAKRNVAGR